MTLGGETESSNPSRLMFSIKIPVFSPWTGKVSRNQVQSQAILSPEITADNIFL